MQAAQPSYLQDESRLRGSGGSIAFPKDTRQLAGLMATAHRDGLPVTLQGARTGLCGGAVPEPLHGAGQQAVSAFGLIINTTEMNAIAAPDGDLLHVMAGASLQDIEAVAAREGLHFAPNPTEATATIGGVFATGAAGPNSLYHGASSRHVEWLRWVTPRGEIWGIQRGEYVFDHSECLLPISENMSGEVDMPDGGIRLGGTAASGDTKQRKMELRTDLPHSPVRAMLPREGMDLIDFLAGSEGRLGAATELRLRLQPLPKALWGVLYFFPESESLLRFAELLQGWQAADMKESMLCCEYYSGGALRLLDASRHNAAMKNLPAFPQAAAELAGAVYIELQGADEDMLEADLMTQLEGSIGCGCPEENTWAESSQPGLARLRALRHALPELVGEHIIYEGDTPLPRLETDYTGPQSMLSEYLAMYEQGGKQAGLECVVYGHLLQIRLHAAFLPREGEQQLCLQIMEAWAEQVVQDGGTLVSENGAGRLKAGLVKRYLSPQQREHFKELDRIFRA